MATPTSAASTSPVPLPVAGAPALPPVAPRAPQAPKPPAVAAAITTGGAAAAGVTARRGSGDAGPSATTPPPAAAGAGAAPVAVAAATTEGADGKATVQADAPSCASLLAARITKLNVTSAIFAVALTAVAVFIAVTFAMSGAALPLLAGAVSCGVLTLIILGTSLGAIYAARAIAQQPAVSVQAKVEEEAKV